MYPYPSDRKRRSQGACDYCRKKKVRCDSATRPGNRCYNCQNAGVECTHNAEQKKRGPRVGTIRKHPSESVQALISALLAEPDTYAVPDDPDTVRKLLLDLAHCVRGLERQLSRWRRTVQEISASNPSITGSGESEDSDSSEESTGDSLAPLATSFPALSFGEHPDQPRRHYGKSSNLVMMRTAVDIKREVIRKEAIGNEPVQIIEKRPEFWSKYPWQRELRFKQPSLIFPPDELFRSLLDLYFTHVHPFFPLLHRPTFERAVSERLHHQDWDFGSVVLCICAIASRYSNDPRNLAEDTTSSHSLGWPWYQQVANIQTTCIEPPSLCKLQYCCLSSFYVMGTSIFYSAWGKVGLGIRFGQEMGVHRKQKSPRTVQNELWRRAYWLLMALDVMSSTNFGRPRATTGDDFDLQLPAECDDEYWENEEPSQAFVQPAGVPSKGSFLTNYAKLLMILGFAHRMLYSPTKMPIFKKIVAYGPGWDQKVVTEINSSLNQWMAGIPDHLKWDPNREDSIFHRQSAALHSLYYWTQMQLHKMFIPRPNESSVMMFPSLAICTNAARCCARIYEALEGTEAETVGHLTYPIYTTATVLLLSIWRNKRLNVQADVSKDLQDVHRCMRIISEYEKMYQIAGRLKDSLTSIMALIDLYFDGRASSQQAAAALSPHSDCSSGSSRASPVHMRPGEVMHSPAPTSDNSNSPAGITTPYTNISHSHSPEPSSSYFNPNVQPSATRLHYDYSLNENPQTNADARRFYAQPQPQHMNVTPPSISSAIPEEDWSSFMANVDVLLQSVDSREYEPQHRY